MNIRIVSDSASSIYSICGTDYKYVPLTVHCEGREYIDTADFDINIMNDHLSVTKSRSSTSCPNMQDWLDAFDGADNIFAVTLTSNLSGSFSAAIQARNEYLITHPHANICIIDSLSAGPEMALILEKLSNLISAGKSFSDIESEVIAFCKHTHLLFALQSLNNFARNGRVSPAKAKLAGVLGIRIVGRASDEGTLEPLHNCRSERKCNEALMQEMHNRGYNGGRVIISHCNNLIGAKNLESFIRISYPEADISIIPCGVLCSYYAENGSLLIGYCGK